MKKALVNPNLTASYISDWSYDSQTKQYTAVYSVYENSQLIEEVADSIFEVAQPLFWLDCDDNVVTYRWYLDISDNQIKEIVDEPFPENEPDVQPQPITNIETI
jgi:hypothetical protein